MNCVELGDYMGGKVTQPFFRFVLNLEPLVQSFQLLKLIEAKYHL